MEAFLARLAYTPATWSDIVENTPSSDKRLAPVRKLLRHFGSSLVSLVFFDTEHSRSTATPPGVVTGEFAMWSGHDPPTITAPPDLEPAHAFNMAVSAEAGLKIVDQALVVPMQDAVMGMVVTKAAGAQTGYVAPGQAKP